jgi:hypothetical protein
MEKIQPIPRDQAYRYFEHKQLIDKINELVIAYNGMIGHEHTRLIELGLVNGSYDQFQAEDEE